MSLRQSSWICQRCLLRTIRPPSLLNKRAIRFYGTVSNSTSDTADHISPVLISRARSIAAEHAQLTQQLNDTFSPSVAKKAGELARVVSALGEWEKAHESIEELRSLLREPNTDSELRSLAADDIQSALEDLTQASGSLTLSLVPKHPFEDLPCLIEIRPGAGGGEAALFAADMLRMYQSFCNSKGYRASLMKYESADGMSDPNGSDSPLQLAILEISDEGAYGIFRSEAGVHRVQRVPATEKSGRTHTSSASVLVLPSFPDTAGEGSASDFDDPSSDYYVDPKEVRVEITKARGAGGQHVNTTDSAVRLTHAPTGITVSMQDFRSQPKNKEKGWQVLRARIAQNRREAREAEIMQTRRDIVGVAKMGRENKVRTYNWGQQRVTDHRSGLSVHDLDDVIEGGDSLEKVMESVRTWLTEGEIQAMASEQDSASKQL